MIPSEKQIDQDLIKMFSTVENTAVKQSMPPKVVISTDNFVDVSKNVWSKSISHASMFERGYISGISVNDYTRPDLKAFINDLFKAIKDNVRHEIDKYGKTQETVNIFLALQHILNLLIEKCEEIQANSKSEEEKIKIENILAGIHGYLTAYIISFYAPELKK